MKFPVEDEEDYYSSGTREVGGYYGNKVYDEINMGTVHLTMALSQLI